MRISPAASLAGPAAMPSASCLGRYIPYAWRQQKTLFIILWLALSPFYRFCSSCSCFFYSSYDSYRARLSYKNRALRRTCISGEYEQRLGMPVHKTNAVCLFSVQDSLCKCCWRLIIPIIQPLFSPHHRCMFLIFSIAVTYGKPGAGEKSCHEFTTTGNRALDISPNVGPFPLSVPHTYVYKTSKGQSRTA